MAVAVAVVSAATFEERGPWFETFCDAVHGRILIFFKCMNNPSRKHLVTYIYKLLLHSYICLSKFINMPVQLWTFL